MSPVKLDIHDLLRSLESGTFYYAPNPGNAGDGLIAQATLQLFRRHSLNWVHLRDPWEAATLPSGKTVVLGGGGHMCHHWNGFATLASRIQGRAKRLVILPHTIEGNDGILADFGSNVDFVCREGMSYQHVAARVGAGCRVHLSDDMALHLDVEAALRRNLAAWLMAKWGFKRSRVGKHLRRLRHEFQYGTVQRWLGQRDGVSVLNCFRTDKESAGWDMPKDNFDASAFFSSADGRYGEADAIQSGGALVRYINQFSIVNTDRLHVGIAGALLGKRVNLHVNDYFKIKAVYETSIRQRFPNVVLIEKPTAEPVSLPDETA
ncbi:polysaccharide pyruvyl transferase family protein [Roseovarius sp.]|uniref:polysaccharide pyruvyl transferase family protein n=1 Tax=Roseovarius sp. TaxID=1486281 RepID=UPI003567C9D4